MSCTAGAGGEGSYPPSSPYQEDLSHLCGQNLGQHLQTNRSLCHQPVGIRPNRFASRGGAMKQPRELRTSQHHILLFISGTPGPRPTFGLCKDKRRRQISSTNTQSQLQRHTAAVWELAQEHLPDPSEHGVRQSHFPVHGAFMLLPPTAAPHQPHSHLHTDCFPFVLQFS